MAKIMTEVAKKRIGFGVITTIILADIANMIFTFKSPNKEQVTLNLFDELSIGDDIMSDIKEHPSKFAFWSAMREITADQTRKLQVDLTKTYAEFDSFYREKLTKDGIKATEDMVKNKVNAEPEIIDLRTKISDSEFLAGRLSVAVQAFSSRGTLLMNLGFNSSLSSQIENMITEIKNKYKN